MMKLQQLSPTTSRARMSRFQRKNELFSKRIYYAKNGGIPAALKDCADTIRSVYLRDNLKAPMWNAAKPELTSRPSVNLYFGQNFDSTDEGMIRAAYAVGSGASSIGLDPSTMRIDPFFPRLIELVQQVTVVVRQKTVWKNAWFNLVSVKIYYTYRDEKGKLVRKTTNWHVDVTLDKKGVPMSNNSQVPVSPVAILTFGDSKTLYFRRHTSRDKYEEDSTFGIPQTSGSLLLLDGRDEMLDAQGRHWRHCSGPSEGVTFSFMFRNVQRQVNVDPFENTIVDAEEQLSDKKRKQFEEGKAHLVTPYYKQQKREIEDKISKLF